MTEETFRDISYTTSLSRIKLVRMRCGLRQMDLSRQIGVSESYLSKIETGRVTPSRFLLARMAEALYVAVFDLEGEIEPPTKGRSA